VAAQGAGQAIAAAQKIDGSGLAVILREDAAIAALRRTKTVPGLRVSATISSQPNWSAYHWGKLLARDCVPHRQLHRKILHVSDKPVRRQDRHNHRGDVTAAASNSVTIAGLHPGEAWAVDCTLDGHRPAARSMG